jgi:hypothetical protein
VKKIISTALLSSTFLVASAGMAATSSQTTLSKKVARLQKETAQLEKELAGLKHDQLLPQYQANIASPRKMNAQMNYLQIVTSPYFGEPTYFNSNLYNMTSMNEDMRLLEHKQRFNAHLAKDGLIPPRTRVELSGGIEGQLSSTSGFGTTEPKKDISLPTAELDVNAVVGNWIQGFMQIDYNDSPISSGNREPNATLYLNRGFLVVGDLDKSPVYGSIGLMFVPYGRYFNGMATTALTVSLGKTMSQAMVLGAKLPHGFYTQVYAYNGSQTSGEDHVFKQGGFNIGLKNPDSSAKLQYSAGGGWISNLADSQGMQGTGSTTGFPGFSASTANNAIAHRVAGFDGYVKLAYSSFTWVAEYLGSLGSFATTDLAYNGVGAKPRAFYTEVDYNLPFYVKLQPSLGVSYGKTYQALALNLPQYSYAVFLNATLMRDMSFTLEYRHDLDYKTTDTANGLGGPASTGTGGVRDTVTGQLSIFF